MLAAPFALCHLPCAMCHLPGPVLEYVVSYMAKRAGQNVGIRYNEAFEMAVLRELEAQDLPCAQMRRKYGIRGVAQSRNACLNLAKVSEE